MVPWGPPAPLCGTRCMRRRAPLLHWTQTSHPRGHPPRFAPFSRPIAGRWGGARRSLLHAKLETSRTQTSSSLRACTSDRQIHRTQTHARARSSTPRGRTPLTLSHLMATFASHRTPDLRHRQTRTRCRQWRHSRPHTVRSTADEDHCCVQSAPKGSSSRLGGGAPSPDTLGVLLEG